MTKKLDELANLWEKTKDPIYKDLWYKFVKEFANVVGTTQTEEFGKMKNFGGFTDGDRCVFLAEFFNAD